MCYQTNQRLRHFVALFATASFAYLTAQPLLAALPAKPNVLVILCDDLGYGDLQCYGHPTIKTPNLDRMAAEGIRFTSCYSASPVCSSSRAGLLTGRTPSRTGVYDWIPDGHPVHLPAKEITIATLLKRAGYQTAHVGKWHLNGMFNSPEQPQPGDHGFDHWFSTQNNAFPSHENPNNFVRNGKEVGPLEGFSCQLVAGEAIAWLESRKEAQPFFLQVCLHEPHEPVASPPELVDEYRPHAKNDDQAQYFANVANVDAAVGRILASLHKLNLDEKTLVIFTSDNGPETLKRHRNARRSYGSPGELRGMKLWLYEGGIRVAGLMRWTGQVPAKQVVDTPVCSVDLLPTLCELAKTPVPDDRPLDGTSLVSLLQGEPLKRTKPLYWHYYCALGQPKVALRSGDWMILGHRISPNLPKKSRNVTPLSMRVIKSATLGNFELYNLANDHRQQEDVGKQHAKKLETLSRQLVARHQEVQAEGPRWEFNE
ncbi:MAG: sulfatase-like hydrolase/transferase [Planctomycetes bacterium]|nr:sulfatase-like hydrolase/transferase [Planctomycetota bacterium]